MTFEELLPQIFNLPLSISVFGFFLGYAILYTCFKPKDIIGGTQGGIIFSPLLGILVSVLIYYPIVWFHRLVNFFLATNFNYAESLTFSLQFALLLLLFINRIALKKPLINFGLEIFWVVLISITLILFVGFIPLILVGLFSDYAGFILGNFLLFIIGFLTVVFSSILYTTLFILKLRPKKLSEVNKLKKPLEIIFFSSILISLIIAIFAYPTITSSEEVYGGITISQGFSNPKVVAAISQNFTIHGGLLNWFPIFYKNIDEATPEFNKSVNEMSYEKFDGHFVFFSNKTSKPLTIILNGKRIVNSSYGNISHIDDRKGENGRILNVTITLRNGTSYILINRTSNKVGNTTYYQYNTTIFNERKKPFNAENVHLEIIEGDCNYIERSSIYHSLQVIPRPSEGKRNSVFAYLYMDNTMDKINFKFSVGCS